MVWEEIKLVVFGAEGVGKSAIINFYIQGHFVQDYDPTCEDSYRKLITLDDTEFIVDMLDTAGEEEIEYYSTRFEYLRGREGFLVVYSITNKNSLDALDMYVANILRVKDVVYVPMVMVGNKCDLESERKVETQAGEHVAERHKAAFCETSAKFGINVNEAFDALYNLILLNWAKRENANTSEKKKACVVC